MKKIIFKYCLLKRKLKERFCKHEAGNRHYSCLCFYGGAAGKIATVYCKKCGLKLSADFMTLYQIHVLED